MAPSWFELLGWVALGVGFASALVIVADVVVLGNASAILIGAFAGLMPAVRASRMLPTVALRTV